jgi:hypothetical protein
MEYFPPQCVIYYLMITYIFLNLVLERSFPTIYKNPKILENSTVVPHMEISVVTTLDSP